MKLENQYCTRLQALKLKELGVSNIAAEWYGDQDNGDVNVLIAIPETCISYIRHLGEEEICLIGSRERFILSKFSEPVKLYSVAELMRMLSCDDLLQFSEHHPAHQLADILICEIESNILNVAFSNPVQINQRLNQD